MLLQPESALGFCEQLVVAVGGIDIGLVMVEAKCRLSLDKGEEASKRIKSTND